MGCEVVEISALKGTGIQKAAEKAVALAQQKKNMVPVHEFSKDAEDVITEVEEQTERYCSRGSEDVSLRSSY